MQFNIKSISSGRHAAGMRRAPIAKGIRTVVTADRADLDVNTMQPQGDRLLVKPMEVVDVTDGGLYISSSEMKLGAEGLMGEVISAGDEVKGTFEEGDILFFKKQGFAEIETTEGPIYFIFEDSVLARLKES